MKINYFTIHKLVASENKVELLDNPPAKTDFDMYITSVIKEIADGEKGKKFKIRDETTQVIGITKNSILNSKYVGQQAIADRLLQKEIDVQHTVQKLHITIQTGLLIQACIEHGKKRKYIICKAENSKYISGRNYKGDDGYPEKKKVIKSFIVTFGDNDEIEEMLITDSNHALATYWWDDFLELDKYHDDVYNTTTAFTAVNNFLSKYKTKYQVDHVHLRNATIKAFRTKGEFNFDSFVETVFRNYVPVDSTLDMNDLAEKVTALPKRVDFDTTFDSVTNEITARLKSVIALNDNIDLHIKQDIDIDRTIKAVLIDNVKYIRIRTDKGYDTFAKKSNN